MLLTVKPLGEYLADCIHEAVSGAGTKEKELVDIITQVTPQEMVMMKQVKELVLS